MDKKYLIELPESDEIGDLVEIMARFAQAEHRFITSLETSSLRLAQSVASLTGKKLLTESLLTAQEGNFLPSQVVSMSWGAEPATESIQEKTDIPTGLPATEDAAIAGKPCMICGKAAMKRSTICGRPECRRERQKGWDAAWKEKKGKVGPLGEAPQGAEAARPVAAESPVSEAAASPLGEAPLSAEAAEDEQPAASALPPFFALGSQMLVFNQSMTQAKLMETSRIQKEIFAEMYPEGNLFQDASNGRFFEARQGSLVPVVVSAATAAAVRGMMEKQPAA